jgi:hypothetical protein
LVLGFMLVGAGEPERNAVFINHLSYYFQGVKL